ncbi:hypothetical protein MLD38_031896 [Melastoma candidum]|uniref:Uncharacterized protein n=1 Tax=Melastoma candidum TaxID=119954 RepID=A0ACB9MVP8_9MYRT|nr:hypothetical protein MLD38_031896 [Melastoma candidum]
MDSLARNNDVSCKNADGSSSETWKDQVVKEKIIGPYEDTLISEVEGCEHVASEDQNHPSSACPSTKEDGVAFGEIVLARAGVSEKPKVLDAANHVIPDDAPSVTLEDTKYEIPTIVTASCVEECHNQQDGSVESNVLKTQGNVAPTEEDSGESKERFRQRLWCFLFENLNRAIDELYLLCELECDLEQMKEAILVLDEASSDFQELTSRVEHFEHAKKSTTALSDGMLISPKTDHRRPHALSWEVRRMTTSSQRAEILSSSIDAFRKIQQERASIRLSEGPSTLQSEHVTSEQRSSSESSDVIKDVTSNLDESLTKSGNSGKCSGDAQAKPCGSSHGVLSGKKGTAPSQGSQTLVKTQLKSSQRDKHVSSSMRKSTREMEHEEVKIIATKENGQKEGSAENPPRNAEQGRRQSLYCGRDKEKRNLSSRHTMDAWKEKRNWEEILSTPCCNSSRVPHIPGVCRRSAERRRSLHVKLMSPEKKKKTALDLKKEADEKHARAMRIRTELENERMQKLQRTSEKLNRVNEWQAVRSRKLKEGMHARHQRGESRHEAYIAQVVRRAGDESSKVNEVRFITSLNEENKKLILRQKLHDSEQRRAEILQVMKTKQKEESAREEAILERRKLIEAEKLQRLAETQRKKEEAQLRREEERKASSAVREARALERLRRKEIREKAQQEEAELLAQKLAEKLKESEQRRKFYLEQIRARASMDLRDQTSPLPRRYLNKEAPERSTTSNNIEDQTSGVQRIECSLARGDLAVQAPLKRRIKRIRQKLMALKHEISDPLTVAENTSMKYRSSVATARAKIGRWIQDLQRLRQARKEGTLKIGLIVAEMIKFLDGKEPELQASREAGLLDFLASAIPASHTSKPEACQVTIHLLKLLKGVLSLPANRSYFLSQNLLPPMIPMLSAALENYMKIAASANAPGGAHGTTGKASIENLETISEVLDGFLWTVTAIMGEFNLDERQVQMKDGLLELLIAYQVIHRLRDLFALYDRTQVEGSPFPTSIALSINLLVVLTSKHDTSHGIDQEFLSTGTESNPTVLKHDLVDCNYVLHEEEKNCDGMTLQGALEDLALESTNAVTIYKSDVTIENGQELPSNEGLALESNSKPVVTDGRKETEQVEAPMNLKQPLMLLLSAVSETELVSLPCLLTSVLLHPNNRLSSEQASDVLPSNFEEVTTEVLKFLNNLARIDIRFLQRLLARHGLRMEFFHLMSFLLSHCNNNWKSPNDQVGLLLLESLLLLCNFSLFHPENQAVLRWGNSGTILHKVCDLPFVFFSDPDLMPIPASTLVAACYGCEQNRDVIQQELSIDMLLSLLKSCRNVIHPAQTQTAENPSSPGDNLSVSTNKKLEYERSSKSIRAGGKNSRSITIRGKRRDRSLKASEDTSARISLASSGTFSMLLCRFPAGFIDSAEKFFSAGFL